MAKLNGKNFKIYSLDTFELVKNRISHTLNTVPEYLCIDNEDSLKEYISGKRDAIDIIAVSLIQVAKDEKDSTDFSKFYEKYKNNFIKPLDLAKIWIAHNNYMKSNDIISYSIQDQIAKTLSLDSRDIEELASSSKTLLKNLEIRIDRFNKREKEVIKLIKQFENAKNIVSTDFTIQASNFTLYFDTDISLFEIFNYIKSSQYCPFASLNNYYKIYKELKPPLEWAVSIPNYIILKVTDTNREDMIKLNTYRNVAITNENNRIKIVVEYTFTEKNVSKEMFIERILSIFDKVNVLEKDNISEIIENKLQGVTYYPKQHINNYIFADLVMNNQLFSTFLSINESVKATKKKSAIFLKFRDPAFPSNEPLSATLSKKELKLYDKDKEIRKKFPVGTKFIRLKVTNATTVDIVNRFFAVLTKLFSLYNELEDDILKIYQTFIPNFSLGVEGENITRKNRLKDIAPEVFVSKYSKKCPAKEMPKIVSVEEALAYPENRRMLFPKTPEEGIQRWYICDDKKYIYPGLRKNTNLSNSEKFPYLPCCYVTDQTNKENSNYYKYYNETNREAATEQQTIFLTMKTATFRGFGILPKRLKSLFELISIDREFLRKGTVKSSSSFIECVLEALYKETRFLKKEGEIEVSRIRKTLKARKRLAKWDYLAVGLQELYDKSIKEIREELLDTDNYISPKKYKSILEEYYNCNIMIFSAENEGELLIPNFSQSYLLKEYRKDRPFIFILENKGTFAEKVLYPQCEIISHISNDGNANYTFSIDDPIVKYMTRMYALLVESYKLGKRIPVYSIRIPDEYIPISQYVDSFGKTRIIRCKKGNSFIDFTVEPIPPLVLKLKDSKVEYPIRKLENDILSIAVAQYRNRESEEILQLELNLGNVSSRVAVDIKDLKIEDLPVKYTTLRDIDTESSLKVYNYKKKISKYLLEYLLKAFAEYTTDTENPENDIPGFLKEKIIIGNNIENEIDKIISNDDIVFPTTFIEDFFLLRNGKVIVPNRDYLERAIFVLRTSLKNNKENVLSYKNRVNFRGIYNDVSDFKKYSNQIIIKGDEKIDSWILTANKNNCVSDSVKIEPFTKEPYFFKNRVISDSIYLAQNVDSLEEAVYIYNLWENNGYNDRGTEYKGDDFNIEITLWNYISRNEILPFKIKGDKSVIDINVLATKKGKIFYTVLLNLSDENK